MFAALVGATVASAIKGTPPPPAGTPPPPVSEGQSAVFYIALGFALLCFLSPLLCEYVPRPAPKIIAKQEPLPKGEPKKPSPPAPPEPPPPKWRYAPPDGIEKAEPERFKIETMRQISDVSSKSPMALSGNGHLLAFAREPGRRVYVVDLTTLDEVGELQFSETPIGLSWAPDSKRLLITSEADHKQLTVFDAAANRWMPLPQPKNARVPSSVAKWWHDDEVVYPFEVSGLSLSLDVLRVTALENSDSWKKLGGTAQKELRKMPESLLPASPLWQVRIRPAIVSYDTPFGGKPWKLGETPQVAFVHPERPFQHYFQSIDVRPNDGLLAAIDGTKVVRVRDNSATVFYLTLREAPPNRFRVRMPSEPEAALATHIAEKKLCAFICAPLTNPLNGKTVGPNRESVKALARLEEWKGNEAVFWIAEEYQNIEKGDVVADVHTWRDSKPEVAGEIGKSEWFAVIETIERGNVPLLTVAKALDKGIAVKAETLSGADRILDMRPIVAVKTPETIQPAPTTPPPVIASVSQKVTNFIEAHHAKSSRGDVDGLVRDYADQCDYFTHGVVNREFIRKDETAYHAPGIKVTETVVGKPIFSGVGYEFFAVKYTIQFHRILPDGKWRRGFSDIEMEIGTQSGEPRITSQRAKTRDVQSGP